jgi:outer membrane protein assembly factor BamB
MNFPEHICPAAALALALVHAAAARADDWPQWRGPNRDGVFSEMGILETLPADRLDVRWRVPVGIGFSSPVTADQRVFVTDSVLENPKARERIHAFDAATGRRAWNYTYEVKYPEIAFDESFLRGPVATPIVEAGRLYTLGASGVVCCLKADNGELLWRKDLQSQYPQTEIYPSSSPLIEGGLLILLVGAKPGASVIALDKATGKEVWKALDEGPTASSPIVVEAGGARQLIIWTDRSVTALNPATGITIWRQRLNTTQDAAVSTPVYERGRLLIGGLMMRLDPDRPAAETVWPRSRAESWRVLSNTSTAVLRDGYVYSARSFGEFVCLDAKTGEEIWSTDRVTDRKSGASVHATIVGEFALLYTDRGELIRTRLNPQGYQEVGRTRVLEPDVTFSGRKCAWAAPAFSNGCIYARTNKQLVCASLADKQ